MKDLRIFKNRDLQRLVIADNSIVCFAKHLNNGVHVPSYFGQKGDVVLLQLIGFLKSIEGCSNITTEISKRVGLESLYNSYVSKSKLEPI